MKEKDSMTHARGMVCMAIVGFVVAAGVPVSADGIVEVNIHSTSCTGTGPLTELEVSSKPTITHLKNVTGPDDGVSHWTNGGLEVAFWDYQFDRGGKHVYWLTGKTTQYSCRLSCIVSETALLAWSERLVGAIETGDVSEISVIDSCHGKASP